MNFFKVWEPNNKKPLYFIIFLNIKTTTIFPVYLISSWFNSQKMKPFKDTIFALLHKEVNQV